jgi:glutamate/tyrosine decarboxylase-like PLP-dependent enzyme
VLDHNATEGGIVSAMDHETARMFADVLARQSDLNLSVSKALQAVALTADRHDAEMAELRDELAVLGARVAVLEHPNVHGFSRKVDG